VDRPDHRKEEDEELWRSRHGLRRGVAAIPSEMSWESFRERYEREHVAGLAKETGAKIDTVCNLV